MVSCSGFVQCTQRYKVTGSLGVVAKIGRNKRTRLTVNVTMRGLPSNGLSWSTFYLARVENGVVVLQLESLNTIRVLCGFTSRRRRGHGRNMDP
jgi:hypothetical protein